MEGLRLETFSWFIVSSYTINVTVKYVQEYCICSFCNISWRKVSDLSVTSYFPHVGSKNRFGGLTCKTQKGQFARDVRVPGSQSESLEIVNQEITNVLFSTIYEFKLRRLSMNFQIFLLFRYFFIEILGFLTLIFSVSCLTSSTVQTGFGMGDEENSM